MDEPRDHDQIPSEARPDRSDHDDALAQVGPDRRAFVKRVVAVTAFATPMIASYDLAALSPSVAHAQSMGNSTGTTTFTVESPQTKR